MKYIYGMLGVLAVVVLVFFTKETFFTFAVDQTQLVKIISVIDAKIPELKEEAKERLEFQRRIKYNGDRYVIKHTAALGLKDIEGWNKKGEYYVVNYGLVVYPEDNDGEFTGIVYISKDLKDIRFADFLYLDFPMMTTSEQRKFRKEEKEKYKKMKQELEKEVAPILTELRNQVKLEKKKELLNKEKSTITSEDLDAYLGETAPELNLEAKYFRLLRPADEIIFEMQNMPNPDATNELEKNYYVMAYTYEGSKYQKRYFIPRDFDENNMLVEPRFSIKSKKRFTESKDIQKHDLTRSNRIFTKLTLYFKKNPDIKEEDLDQETEAFLKEYFGLD